MNLFKKKATLIILLGILFLGIFIRNVNLYTWPRLGATFDEYAWTWQGISLLTTGVPTSWSYHPQYKNKKEIIYRKTRFILVKPYLEHPPAFGLVAGSYALLNGASGMFDITIEKIRGLALIMGTISILLVYLLTKKLYDERTGLIAALLYAVVPSVAVGSRLVQNENFFIPVWLAVLYLTSIFLDKKKSWARNLAAVLCGVLLLAKVPWVAAPFSVCIILLANKRYLDIAKFLAVVIPIFLLYFAYGLYFDKDVFLGLWGLQLNRYDITFSSIYALFQKPFLTDRYLTDGWIYFGWFASILLLTKDFKKNLIVISALVSYFLVFLIAIPDEAGHGWYRYPFYPFLIVAIALFLKEYFAKNWLLTFFFIVFLGTSLLEITWKVKFGFSYLFFRILIISWGLILIPQYWENKRTKLLGKVVSYSWLAVIILLSIRAVIIYNEM